MACVLAIGGDEVAGGAPVDETADDDVLDGNVTEGNVTDDVLAETAACLRWRANCFMAGRLQMVTTPRSSHAAHCQACSHTVDSQSGQTRARRNNWPHASFKQRHIGRSRFAEVGSLRVNICRTTLGSSLIERGTSA